MSAYLDIAIDQMAQLRHEYSCNAGTVVILRGADGQPQQHVAGCTCQVRRQIREIVTTYIPVLLRAELERVERLVGSN